MLALLCATVLAQEVPALGYLKLKPEDLEVPIFAGAKEFIFGVAKSSSQTFSLYVNPLEAGAFNSQPVNYEDVMIGFTSWSVTSAVSGSTPCIALSTKGHRNQTVTRGRDVLGLKHQAERTWYVTEAGKIIAENAEYKMATGTWTMDATYGTEDYTITLSAPGQPKRTLTRSPGCGMAELSETAFRPMLKADPNGKKAEVLLGEKEFWLLDPFTGMPVQLKAKVRGSFNATLFKRFWTGPQVEFTGYREPYSAWVSHEGVLMRIQLRKGLYLQIEQKPD